MSGRDSIGVGVIGLGFMGRTHAAAYAAADRAGFSNRLVAVHDSAPRRSTGAEAPRGNLESEGERGQPFDLEHARQHSSAAELLADPEVDLVSICTPTESHVDLAIAALRAGKHVLVEKPVALSSAEVVRLAEVARDAKTLCMPAMCMRFWPGWTWLKRAVIAGTHGAVRSAAFRRLASRPGWSRDFYGNPERTGGALFDLHVHDADFVRWCFGAPDTVTSAGTPDHVTSIYRYADGPPHVVAEGGWDHSEGFDFRMRYTVVFEDATADFDLGREEQLLLFRDGKGEVVPLEEGTGYDGEVRHLLRACQAESPRLEVTVDEAVAVTRMLEAEREQLS